MKRLFLTVATVLFPFLLLWQSSAGADSAYVRYETSLGPPPSFMSPIEQPVSRLTLSLFPRSHLLIDPRLRLRPTVVRSSFAHQSITFNTVYYRLARDSSTLVPVAVDVPTYHSQLLRRDIDDFFGRDLSSSAVSPAQQQGAKGLGINIGLPKRLDRIFGEGGADLRISGFRKISFSGRSQWTDAAATDSYRQSKFPSLNMEQISRFDIQGTIGQKISVKVSQDTQTDIPLANRLLIRYRGFDDDILKTVEAGNTTLSLPNTQFVGYSSRIQGLFGIKAEAKAGPWAVTAIASQEKGSAETASINALSGQSRDSQTKRDYQYSEGRAFDLGFEGEDFVDLEDSLLELIIYQEEILEENREARQANLYVNPNDTASYENENVRGIRVLRLEPDLYQFYEDPERVVPYVIFKSSRAPNRALGVYMRVQRKDGSVETHGNLAMDTLLVLKLLRPQGNNANPKQKTWGLMWRNCYDVPRELKKPEDMEIAIYKGLPGDEANPDNLDYQVGSDGQTTRRYIEILGLDQYNSSLDRKSPDGKWDPFPYTYYAEEGLLVFPSRRPFDDDTVFQLDNRTTMPLEPRLPNIYDYSSATEKAEASEYYIRITQRGRSAVIPLNRPNVIEGSERVTVNGRTLKRGEGYEINYNFGQVTLLDPDALDPNADVRIDFEYAPFFALQKKTLLGARLEYEAHKDFRMGSTVLYKTDKAQDRKPRVGEETAEMVVYDIDMATTLHPNFLTDWADKLPLVTTEAPSNLRVSAELAQSRPNPNVDNVAYVDDFESALDLLSLGMSRTNWHLASVPEKVEEESGVSRQRGKLLWHRPIRDGETWNVTDIYDREAAPGQGLAHTLRLIYRPKTDSTDSAGNVVESGLPSWAGIMRYFGQRVDANRAELLEIRMLVSESIHGRLHFDFGKIKEKLNISPSELDAEFNEDRYGAGDLNGVVDEDEDVGLDGLPDAREPGHDPATNPDPHGDNWYFRGEGKCPIAGCPEELPTGMYYDFLNGTEGNLKDADFLARPDREQLGTAWTTVNDYFSFRIEFDPDSSESRFYRDNLEVPKSAKTTDRGTWVTYRIPIRDSLYDTTFGAGTITWDQISHVRVWFESDAGDTLHDTIEIADWSFVQLNWSDTLIVTDSTRTADDVEFVVASVSEQDSTFSPPSGVEAYEDPNTGVTERQRGLALDFKNVPNYVECAAQRTLFTVERYSGYRTLEMFVNGAGIYEADILRPFTESDSLVRLIFRVGRDLRNFYEYSTRVRGGWAESNHIKFNFEELANLKDAVLRNLDRGRRIINIDTLDKSRDGYWLRVKGNPNINEIKYFAISVTTDHQEPDSTVSGVIWLDELRVSNVRRDVGTAARVSFDGNIADLLNYSFNYQTKDPYFRGLSGATRGGSSNNLGSGRTENLISYGLSTNLHKFLPRAWGATLPVSYQFSKSTSIPLLRTGTDILLPDEIREAEKSVSRSWRFSISESFRKPGRNPLFTLLLNRLKTSFSYGRSERVSPLNPYQLSENHGINGDFDLGIQKVPTAPIFFWTRPIPIARRLLGSRLGLYPSNWRLSGSYSRSISITDAIDNVRTSTSSRDFSGNMSLSYKMFDNLTMSFSFATRRDLKDLDRVNLSLSRFRLGLETNYNQSFDASYDPRLFKFFSAAWSFKSSYRESYNRSDSTLRGDMTRSWSVGGDFDHIAFLGGRSSGVSGRPAGQPGRRGGKSGQQEAPKADRPFYDPPLAVLRFLTGWLRTPRYSYSRSYDNTVPGMLSRPSWQYRYGIFKEIDVLTQASRGQSQSAKQSKSFDVNTGFMLFGGGLRTDVKFGRSIGEDLIKVGNRFRSTSTTWPGLAITISRFQHLPLLQGVLNKFVDVFAPKTGYSRSSREQVDLESGFLTSENVSVSHNPLLSVNFKVFQGLSLSGTYTLSKDFSKKYNPTTGSLSTETKTLSKSISVSTGYSFKAPGGIAIPIFGRLKFTSTVSLSLDVSMRSRKSETANSGQPFATSVDESDFQVKTSARYRFSQQIEGGMSLTWQDNSNHYQQSTRHSRDVRIWVELGF